ncbi:MAG: thiamine pyrophosphate-dependent dehydrogenase E1 component subunit alpha [Desulfatirhabdiaceae bacterium]
MLRIRKVQERIDSLYLENEIKTPVHLYIGQEAIAVGVCSALRTSDYISSNHRGHGHFLAKGGNLKSMVAELYCKQSGCSKGVGGSMHLVDTAVGHMGSSSIVGGGIPIGTGLGLAAQLKGTDQVCAIFFGDGAADEGVLYESINFAMLKKLPVIYVLENNEWSVCSHVSSRQADENIFHRASQHLLATRKIDGNDVMAVYNAAVDAVNRARNNQGPSFIECETYRLWGHAGCASQDPKGYRSTEEIECWKIKCPVQRFQNRLVEENLLNEQKLTLMAASIAAEIDDAFAFAQNCSLPDPDQLYKNLFCELS